MKLAVLIVRILLGLMFFVFGLNGILHFMPNPKMPPSDGVTWMTILSTHPYFTFIALLMVIAGLLLLVGRYVPVALVLLGPILVNILLFHITLAGGQGIAAGLVATLLELFLIYAYRRNFASIFEASPPIER